MAMTDIDQALTVLQDNIVLLIALSLVVLALLVFLSRKAIKHLWLKLRTRYCINHMGLKQIVNFSFPDGLGNHSTVDRLIMRQDGISLLVFKQYPGSIFCADDIDEWTQLLVGKSYRFKNPLVDLDYQIKAVSAIVPDVPVNGFLFFDYQARFPKGCPERVINLDSIPGSLKRDRKVKAQASVLSAWETLSAVNSAS